MVSNCLCSPGFLFHSFDSSTERFQCQQWKLPEQSAHGHVMDVQISCSKKLFKNPWHIFYSLSKIFMWQWCSLWELSLVASHLPVKVKACKVKPLLTPVKHWLQNILTCFGWVFCAALTTCLVGRNQFIEQPLKLPWKAQVHLPCSQWGPGF